MFFGPRNQILKSECRYLQNWRKLKNDVFCKLWPHTSFWTGSGTGSWRGHLNVPFVMLHFSFCFDVLAWILTELSRFENFEVFVTSSTRHLTFLLEKLYTSSQVKVTTDDAVWWRYLKAFVSYRVPNGHTDRHMKMQSEIAVLAKIAAKWHLGYLN